MPTRKVVLPGLSEEPIENEELLSQGRLEALREAARIGIADVEAGRFRLFEPDSSLSEYLRALTGEILGPSSHQKSTR